jgi:hypothetical protein
LNNYKGKKNKLELVLPGGKKVSPKIKIDFKSDLKKNLKSQFENKIELNLLDR